jgi:hypothetical protein
MENRMLDFKTKIEENVYKNNLMSKFCAEQNTIPELYINANSTSPLFVGVSENYVDYVKNGKIKIRKQVINSYVENGVILDDGTFEQADIVIFATGYHLKLDFIDKNLLESMEFNGNDSLQPLILYKGMFHPDIEDFVCVGMIKEAICVVSELQGRWASLVFSGKVKLPSREVMIEGMNKEREFRTLEMKPQTPRLETLAIYADEIAKEINLMPDFEYLKKFEPEIYRTLWEGPLCAVNYRLKEEKDIAVSVLHEIDRVLDGYRKN